MKPLILLRRLEQSPCSSRTPFIYQGQEIGMVNYPFQQIDELDAKDSHNHYRLLIESGYDAKQALKEVAHWTRDHSRTMQWTSQEASSFTSGHPWLAIHPNFKEMWLTKKRMRNPY